MELKDLKRTGIGHYYRDKESGRKCYITGLSCDDGACLIIELFDEEETDICGELRYSEDCFLTYLGPDEEKI